MVDRKIEKRRNLKRLRWSSNISFLGKILLVIIILFFICLFSEPLQWNNCLGYCQRGCTRYWQEYCGSCVGLQQLQVKWYTIVLNLKKLQGNCFITFSRLYCLQGYWPWCDDAVREDLTDRDEGKGRHYWFVRSNYSVTGRNDLRRQRDGETRSQNTTAYWRSNNFQVIFLCMSWMQATHWAILGATTLPEGYTMAFSAFVHTLGILKDFRLWP